MPPPRLESSFLQLHVDDGVSPLIPDAPRALVVMPYINRDLAERSAEQLCSRAGMAGTLLAVEDCDRQGFVAIINQVYRRTRSEFLAYVAEDAFGGRQWLARGISGLEKSSKALLGFNDGKWAGALAAFGVARRSWVDRNYGGDFFCPCYRRHYADVELTLLALNGRQYCYDPNSVLVEVDWNKDGAPVEKDDRALFRQRAESKFDGRIHDPALLGMFS